MKTFKLTLAVLAAAGAGVSLALAAGTQQPPDSQAAPVQPAAAAGAKSAAAIWLTDLAAAQQQARVEGKPILLDFTGSDWCGWCRKLDREIFSTPEFREFAGKHLVLVKVDFPMHHEQSAAERLQNEQLAAGFQVQGYPTIIVLQPDGGKLGTLGYMSGGPKPFIAELAELLAG